MNAQLKPDTAAPRMILDEAPETYYMRSLDEASNTGMTILDERTPAHFAHWVSNPDDEEASAALNFGRAFHCATLEPETFARTYSVLPADAPQRPTAAMLNAKNPSLESMQRQDWWRAWNQANAGRTILTAKDYDRCCRMADTTRAHVVRFGEPGNQHAATLADLLDSCAHEVTFRWVDEASGVKCKARLDGFSQEMQYAIDLKSTRDASKEAFQRAVYNYRYHQQHANYVEAAKACQMPVRWFIFIPVESTAPFLPASYQIDAHAEARGFELRERALAKQAECLRTGRWPGYSESIEELTLPHYHLTD